MRPGLPYLIYIVEDDEDERLLLRMTLADESAACSLHFFSHGADLFVRLTHQFDGRLPDLIVLDLDTPVMNGFETLQLLKQTHSYRRIPVVIRSGYQQIEHINRCYELGCEAYLTKQAAALPLPQLVCYLN